MVTSVIMNYTMFPCLVQHDTWLPCLVLLYTGGESNESLKRNSNMYFYVTFAAYFLVLMATIFVMHMFKHAQPALLYLVPACLGTPLSLAIIKGDLKAMFQYEDHPSEKQTESAESKKSAAKAKKGK